MAQWEVADKTFLITGGAKGLGAAYAEAVLRDNAKNVAILDVAEEVGKAKAESLNKTYGDKVVFIKCDVSKEEDIVKAFEEVVAQFKQVDVLVNNAGVLNDSLDNWRIASYVNWQGVVSFTRKGITHMRKDEGGVGGTIINIASAAACMRTGLSPIYSGSKIAVLHFTQCISMPPFYERTGVRMLTMCPGATDTAILRGIEKRAYDAKVGGELFDFFNPAKMVFQKLDSLVNAVVHMFKNGGHGTIWSSANDNPASEITSSVDKSFKVLEEAEEWVIHV